MGFWFSLVLLAVPLGTAASGGVGPIEALFAAREVVGDIAGLCERKPEVCETGQAAFQTIGVRARESSRIAFELLDDRFGEAALPSDAITTGTVAEEALPPAIEEATAMPAATGGTIPLPETAPLPPRRIPAWASP